jgi:hypothetical protein
MCRATCATILVKSKWLPLSLAFLGAPHRKALVLKHFSWLHQLRVVYGGIAAELGPRAV